MRGRKESASETRQVSRAAGEESRPARLRVIQEAKEALEPRYTPPHKGAAATLPRVWQPAQSFWLCCPGQPCRQDLGFSKTLGRAWQRAVTAPAGDSRLAVPPFTVDLDRAAAPRQAWSSLAISWALGGIGRSRYLAPRPHPPFTISSSPVEPPAPSSLASLPPCPQLPPPVIQLCLLRPRKS